MAVEQGWMAHVVNSRDVKRHIFQGLVRWAEAHEGCRSPRIHEKKLVVVSDESNARTDGGLLGTEAFRLLEVVRIRPWKVMSICGLSKP